MFIQDFVSSFVFLDNLFIVDIDPFTEYVNQDTSDLHDMIPMLVSRIHFNLHKCIWYTACSHILCADSRAGSSSLSIHFHCGLQLAQCPALVLPSLFLLARDAFVNASSVEFSIDALAYGMIRLCYRLARYSLILYVVFFSQLDLLWLTHLEFDFLVLDSVLVVVVILFE